MIVGISSLIQILSLVVDHAMKTEAASLMALVFFLPVRLFCLPSAGFQGKEREEGLLTWGDVGPIF